MDYDNNSGQMRQTFNIPAAAGNYAPEELFLKVLEPGSAAGLYQKVRQLRILLEAAPPAGGVIEIWVLRVGGDPTNIAHWFNSGINVNAVGLSALIELAGVNGARLRAKSGGAVGAVAVDAWWV